MTTFNTNLTSELSTRTTIGPTKIRSPTRYSDMFVGAHDDVIEAMLEGNQQESSRPVYQKKNSTPSKHLSRYERLTKLRNDNRDIQTIPDVHYRVVDSIPDALNAAVELANYHSISVLWEGFDVNRHGVLTWIICGYLGSAVLFNIRKFGAKIFTEGGLKTLLEARHPIKVIHDCSCLADILFNQYNVELKAESIFDTHAADLLIQSKTSQELTAKTLTECLIEYQDIPISVYRQRESLMRDPTVWVRESIPPELLLLTARIARYAVLLHGIMLRELSKPLPQITEIYLNCRIQDNSPDPKTRSRHIPPDVETLLIRSKQFPVVRTEWNIPETVLNPVYETQPGDEHFYSKPFKFDPKKATPGSLKIFSVNPNRPVMEDDCNWENFVHGAPKYSLEEEEEEEEDYEPELCETRGSEEQGDLFKIPDIFSDVTTSSEGVQGDLMTSRDVVTSRDVTSQRVSDEDGTYSSSSSDDNVNIIMPECSPPPTVAAIMNPSLLGSKMIFAGDPRYNDPAHKPPVMSAELSALVEKIRAESKNQIRSQAFITAEEMRRNLEEERRELTQEHYPEPEPEPEPETESCQSSEIVRITENKEPIRVISPHYEIISSSSSSSSSDVILEEGQSFSDFPKRFIQEPVSPVIKTSPREQAIKTSPPQTSLFQASPRPPQTSPHRTSSPARTSFLKTSSEHSSPPDCRLLTQTESLHLTEPAEMNRTFDVSAPGTLSSPPPLVQTSSLKAKSSPKSGPSHDVNAGKTEQNSSHQIPKFSDLTTSIPRSLSNESSGSKRKPLIIIPKSRAGRGRANPQPGRIPSLVPNVPTKGRGRATAIANRDLSRDFSSRTSSISSATSESFYHSDFYGPGVTVSAETLDSADGGKVCSGGGSLRGSVARSDSARTVARSDSARSGAQSQKQPVSLCFASDSDDPDNY